MRSIFYGRRIPTGVFLLSEEKKKKKKIKIYLLAVFEILKGDGMKKSHPHIFHIFIFGFHPAPPPVDFKWNCLISLISSDPETMF